MSDLINNSASIANPNASYHNSDFEAFGPNSGLVEEMYQQYLQNPSSVGEGWIEFFADYKPLANRDSRSDLTTTDNTHINDQKIVAPSPSKKTSPVSVEENSTPSPIRGVGAKIVEN